MTDHDIENNLENPLVSVAARANELALQVSLLRDRSTDETFRKYLELLHDVLYGYAVDVYYTLSGQRHSHSDMVNARYYLHNAVPYLLRELAMQFPDMEILNDAEHDFVLDLRDALVFARRQFRESIHDFHNHIVENGGKVRLVRND